MGRVGQVGRTEALAAASVVAEHAIGREPQSPVDDQRDAGDVRRRVRTQEEGRVGDILDRRHAAERALGDNACARGIAREAAHAFRTFGGTGSNAVHADAVRPPFGRERARERIDAGLRGRRMRLPHRAEILQRRADVQDYAAARFQMRERRARDVERPLQIDIDNRAEPVRGEILGGADEIAGRAVHDDIQMAKRGGRLSDGALHRRGVAHICGKRQRANTNCADLGGGAVQMLALPAHDRDVASMPRQRQRDAAADARAATRDERGLSFQ
jgi:hypothetical protein